MDFDLNLENTMIRDAVKDWVSKECTREVVGQLEEQGQFPQELFNKLGTLGFSGMMIPERFAGAGVNTLAACIVVEELASAYPVLANCYIGPTFFGGAVISELGSESQKERYLEKIAAQSLMTSLAFAEPEDADVEFTETTAKQRGDQFVIRGEKAYVSLADQAELLIVLARTDGAKVDDEVTLFCVDAKAEGVEVSRVDTMGQWGANTCDISFNDVEVSAADILGGEAQSGKGRQQLASISDTVQLAYAASAVGMAQGAFEYALDYARQRVQFGQVIARYPAIGHMLSDVAAKTEAARLMVYRAAWLREQGKSCSDAINMARCLGAEVAVKSAMDGLQILGGYGYTMEYDIQRYVRDSTSLFSAGKSLDYLKEKISESLVQLDY
ncbi:hypothetical protein HBA55_19025 [Pseudomaricurvus alkylphenolicus]|uniref:acyl-CoA dehydrogenase family protein n=1 Tax=Pseudomaricurvus alkylphenolicus TaxID=1306991 RepID=UPI0014238F3E|nr:acyl-CoA dehydrogenase family protein [Pseudomaricurvus alkylphenolicus]NIB41706.1 hypothetical protein [Pseudomaricurvus alkylphenolicus]